MAGILSRVQHRTSRGSLNWWAAGPGVQASSSVIVNKDGSLLRVVPDTDGPWTNGDVKNPSERGKALVARARGQNLNCVSVTIEAEGMPDDEMPEPQLESICWMTWEWMRRHRLGIGDILRHADINSVDRAHCPGRYFERGTARLKAAVSE